MNTLLRTTTLAALAVLGSTPSHAQLYEWKTVARVQVGPSGSPSKPAVDENGSIYFGDVNGGRALKKLSFNNGVWTSSTLLAGDVFSGVHGDFSASSTTTLFKTEYDSIRKVSFNGANWTAATIAEDGPFDLFYSPEGLVAAGPSRVFVANTSHRTIVQLDEASPRWTYRVIASVPYGSGLVDGTNEVARFIGPNGIAARSSANLFVADGIYVREMVQSGGNWVVTTIAGQNGQEPYGQDGPAENALFNPIGDIAVDASGHVYFTEGWSHIIRKLVKTEAGWMVSTIGGTPRVTGDLDGTGSTARFGVPAGIEVDPSGNVIVTEQGRIVVGTPIFGPPVIASQPVDQTVVEGGTASFSVTTEPNRNLRYRWWADGQLLLHATNSSLTLNPVARGQAGSYSVVITNASGSVTSRMASLSVLYPPTLTVQPSSQTVGMGGTAIFTVEASGNPAAAYQWRMNGTNLPGATGPVLTVPANDGMAAGYYDVVVSNSAGTNTSEAASLAVTDLKLFAGVVIHGPIGATYLIEATNTLGGEPWTSLTNVVLPSRPYVFIDYCSPTNPVQFYRTRPIP